MSHSPALLAAIGKLPDGHSPLAAYKLLRKHKLPLDQPPPLFPYLSQAANQRLALGHKSGWICSICGKVCSPATGTIDHHIPRSKGGSNAAGNLRWAHKSCNQKKADSLPEEVQLDLALTRAALTQTYHRQAPARPQVITLEIKLQITVTADGAVSIAPPAAGIVAT
ncbi:HNH endonuclease [Devosia albogilva]|uniref:HNH endonuclease n=1 Tax=Devosia albogilva TaxID=429726 RepID=A0ABW5QPE3_9HYPH